MRKWLFPLALAAFTLSCAKEDEQIQTPSAAPLSEEVEAGPVYVEGVAEVAGLKTRDIKSKFGFKNAPNGVKIDKTEEGLVIYLAIIIDSRHSIPETTAKLRERIKQTLEAMTDNDVKAVNIKISGVHVESEQD